jgi:hypothetical protein
MDNVSMTDNVVTADETVRMDLTKKNAVRYIGISVFVL